MKNMCEEPINEYTNFSRRPLIRKEINLVYVALKFIWSYTGVTKTKESHRLFYSSPQFFRCIVYTTSVFRKMAEDVMTDNRTGWTSSNTQQDSSKDSRDDTMFLQWFLHCE